MAELCAQALSRPEPWHLTKSPAGLTTVTLVTPLVVTFDPGGARDTLAAGTVATVYGGSATTFDTSRDVYVLITSPGSGTVQAVKEADLATITGDWAGLVRVLQHQIDPYQPRLGSGTESSPVPALAWTGGAVLRVPRSWSGGATVAGVPYNLTTHGNLGYSEWRTSYSFWVNVGAVGSDIILADYSGSGFYARTRLSSSGAIVAELHWATAGFTTTLTCDLCGGVAIVPGSWYWVSVNQRGHAPDHKGVELRGYVLNPDATIVGGGGGGDYGQYQTIVFGAAYDPSIYDAVTLSATVGLGINVSGGGYGAFPNTAGWYMSKFYQVNQNLEDAKQPWFPALVAPRHPSLSDYVDPFTDYFELKYMAEQIVGPASALTDTSGNGRDAGASGGLTIWPVGPYAQ